MFGGVLAEIINLNYGPDGKIKSQSVLNAGRAMSHVRIQSKRRQGLANKNGKSFRSRLSVTSVIFAFTWRFEPLNFPFPSHCSHPISFVNEVCV